MFITLAREIWFLNKLQQAGTALNTEQYNPTLVVNTSQSRGRPVLNAE